MKKLNNIQTQLILDNLNGNKSSNNLISGQFSQPDLSSNIIGRGKGGTVYKFNFQNKTLAVKVTDNGTC